MARYSIESNSVLGISHSGAVSVEGESSVELSDQEVDILVNLIREKDTTDVEELDLEHSHPQLYAKLENAYYQMAYDAEEIHWLWEGYYENCFDYSSKDLIEYCKSKCGFTFEYDEEDFLDHEGNIDSDKLEDEEQEAFSEWLDDYLGSLSDKEAVDFFYNHMNANLDLDDIDYTVKIPDAIIEKAEV